MYRGISELIKLPLEEEVMGTPVICPYLPISSLLLQLLLRGH